MQIDKLIFYFKIYFYILIIEINGKKKFNIKYS
jgi:hypothetical protein